MDWDLLSIVFAIFVVLFVIVLLWGVGKSWRANKFISLVLLAIAVAVGIGFYAIFGKRFLG